METFGTEVDGSLLSDWQPDASGRFPPVGAARAYYQRGDIAAAILAWCKGRAAFLHYGPPLSDTAEEGIPLRADTAAELSGKLSEAFGDARPRDRPALYPTASAMPERDCEV